MEPVVLGVRCTTLTGKDQVLTIPCWAVETRPQVEKRYGRYASLRELIGYVLRGTRDGYVRAYIIHRERTADRADEQQTAAPETVDEDL